jgi:Zn-dependent M28 family amino/carboxypeptidase
LGRNPAGLEAAARYIETALKDLGYTVETQPYTVDGLETRNIAASIEPADAGAPTVVLGAHYDSFPGSPGANDNASGTAVLIELARLLADLRGTSAARIRLVFFTNEEPPHFHTEDMGSYRYAMMLAGRKERVAAMISLETMGFYSSVPGSQRYPFPLGLVYPAQGDFVAFVAMPASRRVMQRSIEAFRRHATVPSVGGAAPGFLRGIDWSDHWSFEQFDYPGIMVTDTAYFRDPNYHTAADTPDKLDYDKLARIVGGVDRMIRDKLPTLIGPAAAAR